MPVPDYQSLMVPVLSAAADGEVRIGDVVERLADQLGLTPEERAELLPSGKQTLFANRVHWPKTYLGKAGLVELPRRAYFRITDRGRRVLASHPERIDNAFLNQFAEFRQFKEKSAQGTSPEQSQAEGVLEKSHETPDEVMRTAHKQIEAALGQDLLDRIYASPPAFFERLIVGLLLKNGLRRLSDGSRTRAWPQW